MAAGINPRHARSCRKRDGKRCNCNPSYEAWVYSKRDGKKISKRFKSLAEAKGWRADASRALQARTLRPSSGTTLATAAEAWLGGVKAGTIRTRSGDFYKPSAIRSYERALRLRILPKLGSSRLSDIRRIDVQDLADRLYADGLDPSTIKNTLDPLRSIYRRAVNRDEVAIYPTTGLELPAARGKRERIASPEEASMLLEALPEEDRALWATAFYAGLRRGELRALKWSDIDLKRRIIRVERSLDDGERKRPGEEIEPKSNAGRRRVPIFERLHPELAAHKLRTGRRERELVFGRTCADPFVPSTVRRRALDAWKKAGLEPIGLHEARHTAASTMIAAGADINSLSTAMGHASVTITVDRYGHLIPGSEAELAARVKRLPRPHRAGVSG
jgi:integrase